MTDIKTAKDVLSIVELMNASKLNKHVAIQENTNECFIKGCDEKPKINPILSCCACMKHGKLFLKPFIKPGYEIKE